MPAHWYAEAYGAKEARVNAICDFIPTLNKAFADGGVHLVAASIDYSENTRVLVDEFSERLPVASLHQGKPEIRSQRRGDPLVMGTSRLF